MLDLGIKSHLPPVFHTSILVFADQPSDTQSEIMSQVTGCFKQRADLSFKKELPSLRANWSGFKASFHAMVFGTNPIGIFDFPLLPASLFLGLRSVIILYVPLCLLTHPVPGPSSVTFL